MFIQNSTLSFLNKNMALNALHASVSIEFRFILIDYSKNYTIK
jgi:hypothetical protein